MAPIAELHARLLSQLSVSVLLVGFASSASGFAEDVCPVAIGGGWDNCPTQPCAQGLAESGNLACETIAMATTFLSQAQSAVLGEGRRSTLHMDATYYMAQAVGFTPRQAYQIAAYDQVPDRPRFEFLDQAGSPVVTRSACEADNSTEACELVPTPLTGFDRNNFSGGGLNYHFMAPLGSSGSGPVPMDGLAPNLTDPYSEHFLVHVRRWAFSESELLCKGGLTVAGDNGDYATGDRCYVGSRASPSYLGSIPFISETSPLTTLNWETKLGEQSLTIEEPYVGASDLDTYVGPEVAPLAALGVYVHAVADRISHQLCVKASRMEGPRSPDAADMVTLPLAYDIYMLLINLSNPDYLLQQILTAPIVTDPDFQLVFDNDECDQPSHASRHTFEAGHEQDSLLADHQTLRPGLRYVYDELLAYAASRGFARSAASGDSLRDRTIEGLTAAITMPGADERLAALTEFAQGEGYLPLPGYGGVDYSSWSAKAGALAMTRTEDPASGGGRSGGSMQAPMLLVLFAVGLVATFIRSRRLSIVAGLAPVAAAALAFTHSGAQAFAEDLCPATNGGWTNCQNQLCPTSLAESGNLICESLAMATNIVGQRLGGNGRRSILHMDATYYLAQAVGFTPRQAFQIAIYDQTADLGQVDFHGQDGEALVAADECDLSAPAEGSACELVSKSTTGFDRNNFTGGGLNYHFMAPQMPFGSQPSRIDPLSPNLRDPYGEHFLVHVRRWAFGESQLLCVGGLTTQSVVGDFATGERCFSGTRQESAYLGQIPFVNETKLVSTVSWLSPTGVQLINASDPEVRVDELSDYVGRDIAPLLALGIYVHAVADRISHQLCVMSSTLEGPRPADAPAILTLPFGYDVYMALQFLSNPAALLEQLLEAPVVSNPDFLLKFDDAQCDQPSHASRHTFEVGREQASLKPDHQTLRPALGYVYDELMAFAKLRGFSAANAQGSDFRDQFISGLVRAIELPTAQERIDALTLYALEQGYLPLPGHGGLDYPDWSAKAGTMTMPHPEPVATPNSDLKDGGGALSPLTLLSLLLLMLLFRWGHQRHFTHGVCLNFRSFCDLSGIFTSGRTADHSRHRRSHY